MKRARKEYIMQLKEILMLLDKIKDSVMAGWLLIIILVLVTGGAFKRLVAWVLTKLYELFIASKDHVAPN